MNRETKLVIYILCSGVALIAVSFAADKWASSFEESAEVIAERKAETQKGYEDATEQILKNEEGKTRALDLQLEIQKSQRETERLLKSGAMNRLSWRSTYEATVEQAISKLDQFKTVDHATEQLMENSKEWYSLYRDSESTNFSSNKDDVGADLMPIHRKTVRELQTPDEQLAAVHALVDFVEQYRLTKDSNLREIKNRSTNHDSPSDEYKKKYIEVSKVVFDTATAFNRSDDVSGDFKELSYEELTALDQRFPLFPKGSRWKDRAKEESEEDDRLFGKAAEGKAADDLKPVQTPEEIKLAAEEDARKRRETADAEEKIRSERRLASEQKIKEFRQRRGEFSPTIRAKSEKDDLAETWTRLQAQMAANASAKPSYSAVSGDIRTLIRSSQSAKDRSTALSELCRYFRRIVLIVHGLDGRVADADAIKNGADALKDFDEGLQIIFPGLTSSDMIEQFFRDGVSNELDQELDVPLEHLLQAVELRTKLMSAGKQKDR